MSKHPPEEKYPWNCDKDHAHQTDLDDEAPEPTCGGCYCCRGTGYYSGDELRAQIARLRALIARIVVVMDGSWDLLSPDAQDQLAEELRCAALGGDQ